ncbi:MAG: hypothetical protein V3U71_08795 [Cocleimonas sp.]
MRILSILVFSMLFTSCSTFSEFLEQKNTVKNPLKTTLDLKIEKTLIGGNWNYERQADDCKDTNWQQTFHKNRYYQSLGSACLLADAFSVEAESWYTKNQTLYITNLSPNDGDDIIMKYTIAFLNENKLVLTRGKFKYTFLK